MHRKRPALRTEHQSLCNKGVPGIKWPRTIVRALYNVAFRECSSNIFCRSNTYSADDKEVVSYSQKGLQQLMDNLNKVTREFIMQINVKKMKVMCIGRKRSNLLIIYIDGKRLE